MDPATRLDGVLEVGAGAQPARGVEAVAADPVRPSLGVGLGVHPAVPLVAPGVALAEDVDVAAALRVGELQRVGAHPVLHGQRAGGGDLERLAAAELEVLPAAVERGARSPLGSRVTPGRTADDAAGRPGPGQVVATLEQGRRVVREHRADVGRPLAARGLGRGADGGEEGRSGRGGDEGGEKGTQMLLHGGGEVRCSRLLCRATEGSASTARTCTPGRGLLDRTEPLWGRENGQSTITRMVICDQCRAERGRCGAEGRESRR